MMLGSKGALAPFEYEMWLSSLLEVTISRIRKEHEVLLTLIS